MNVKEKEISAVTTDECCPLFHPAKWDNMHHTWKDKLFLKDAVPEVFHIPLPGTYRKAITRMFKKAEEANAAPPREDWLLLAHDPSSFKGELYMAVTRDIPGAAIARLSGNYFSKVFEGSYADVRKCLKEMHAYMAANEMLALKDYIYFPYCPKCAEKYGHNYVVVVSESAPL